MLRIRSLSSSHSNRVSLTDSVSYRPSLVSDAYPRSSHHGPGVCGVRYV